MIKTRRKENLTVAAQPMPSEGTFWDKMSRRAWRLESQELCAQARRRTGLENFGEPSIEPALTILTSSLEDEANLHPVGRLLMRIHLKDILDARLRMAKKFELQAHALSAQPVLSPIFITGMPRSGSTFLHELLVQDSALRAPRVWEVMLPTSAAQPDMGWRDLRVWQAAWNLWWFRRLAPQMDTVYPMRARTPQECIVMHSYTFLSEEFLCTCRLPTYHAFLRSSDLSPAYAWEKRFLQFLQSGRPPAQWILKSPDHVRSLEALFSVFPDALIVQTHRNPLDVLRSAIHLTEVLQRFYARPPSREWMAETEAKSLAGRMERVIQFRDQHPELANRFVDVNYSDLTADPLNVVRRIYRHFKMPLSDGAIERMSRLAESRSAYKGRRSAPTLGEVGLNPSAQVGMFSEYCRRFGLPSGSADATSRAG
jgi:Sulfotransferase family